MADIIRVSQADVDGLAQKLDEFTAVLTDRERIILHGVLSIAGKSIDELVAGSPGSPQPTSPSSLPSLAAGFREAFEHGIGTKFTVESQEAEKVNVKGSIGIDASN